jgi:beta-1,4-mannosyltransferase
MVPTFHGVNEYGRALVESIQQEGVALQFIPQWTRFLPLVKMLRMSGWPFPQIVHLQWIDTYTIKPAGWQSLLASAFYVSGLLLLRALGIRIVWTVHDYYAYHDNRFARLDVLVRKITARLANAIIIHSEAARDEVAHLYGLGDGDKRKINAVPLGHYVGRYPNTLSRNEARRQLGLDPDVFLFGIIGYICPYKGILHLVQAFRRIEGRDVHLLIAGKPFDASFGQAVAGAAKSDNRIHLHLAFIEDAELQVFLNAVDVVVLPFTQELASSSLMLAMSFGKGVIASSGIASAPEVLHPEGGLVYSAEDPQGLLRALHKIQAMDVVSMGQKNLERAQTFDWQSIARATIRIYRQAMQEET